MSKFCKRVKRGYAQVKTGHYSVTIFLYVVALLSFVLMVVVELNLDKFDLTENVRKFLTPILVLVWFFGNAIHFCYEVGAILENGEINKNSNINLEQATTAVGKFLERVKHGYVHIEKVGAFKANSFSLPILFHVMRFLSFFVVCIVVFNLDNFGFSEDVSKFLEIVIMFSWLFVNIIYLCYKVGTMLENGEIDDGKNGEKDENV